MAKIQLFEPYCCHRSNNVNNRANTSITKFVFKKVPRHELTQLILKRNIEKSSQDNEYSYLSHRIQQEHVRRCLYDIQSHVGQNQKKKIFKRYAPRKVHLYSQRPADIPLEKILIAPPW